MKRFNRPVYGSRFEKPMALLLNRHRATRADRYCRVHRLTVT